MYIVNISKGCNIEAMVSRGTFIRISIENFNRVETDMIYVKVFEI